MGDVQTALGVLKPLLTKARAAGVPSYVVLTLRHLAEAQLAAGAHTNTRATIEEALALAERCRMHHERQRLRALKSQIESI
jgi:hypothetical protein